MLLLLGAGFVYVRVKLEGPDLGDKIASILNKRMRGRIEIGSLEWPTSALKKVVTGGWVQLTVHDVKVWDDCALSAGISAADPDQLRVGDPNEDCTPDDRPDPDPTSKRKPRKLLLTAPEITAEVDIHALMFGHHDFVFRNLWVHGGEALIEQTTEPYPLHAYDRTIVSIVTAFYPRMKAGFRAGIYATEPPPTFDLRDIHVEHLNLTVHIGPYTNKDNTVGYGMTARLDDVNADADRDTLRKDSFLHMNATDPLVAKFYVRLALRGSHGRVRIMDDGPRGSFHIPGTQGLGDEWAKGRSAWYDIELSEIVLKRLAQLPTEWPRKDYVANTLELDLSAHTIPCKTETGGPPSAKDGADLHVAGELDNWWDRPYDGKWNLALDIKNFGPTLRTCIKSKMGGDNLGGRITLTGPYIALPKVTLDLHDLDFDVPLSKAEEPLRLTLAEVHGEIDLVNETGSIEKTKALIRGGQEPGEVMVSSTFGLKPYNAKASVDIVKPIDIARFLPPKVATGLGHYVAGKITASGDVDYGFALEDFDLTLGATPADKFIHAHRGRIFTNDDFDTVQIQKVAVEAGGRNHAVFDGKIDTIKSDLDLRIDGDFPDLDLFLRRLGLPQFAKSAGGGTIVIHGPLKSPTVAMKLNLAGVPCMNNLTLDAEVKDQIATIHHVGSTGLGGQLDGHGVVALGGIDPVIQSFHLDGRGLDGAKLCGTGGLVKGTLDTLDVDVKKTTVAKGRTAYDWLSSFVAHAKAKNVSVMGDTYSDVALCINRSDDDKLCRKDPTHSRLDDDDLPACEDAKRRGGFCAVMNAHRDAGGQLGATIIDVPAGRVGRGMNPAHLNGTIALDDVPLAVIEPFIGKDRIGGLFSATLHLQGQPAAPQAAGNIYLQRGWLVGALLGDSQLQVDPIQIGKTPSLFVHGNALAGQLQVSATIGTQAPYPVEVALTGRRVELDQFMDLTKKLGLPEPVQVWASGTVTVHTELAPLSGQPAQPEAWVEVTELEAIVNHRTRDGRLTPLRFHLVPKQDAYALSLRATPAIVEIARRNPTAPGGRTPDFAMLATPAGLVKIEGSASPTNMHLVASSANADGTRGKLDLKRLAPLFESQLESIAGKLDLDATVTGTFANPSYELGVQVEDVRLRPAGGDTELQMPTGLVKLANGSLGFTDVKVTVKDEHKAERGDLSIAGNIGLDGLKPTSWAILIEGKIAGKMLLVAAPSALAQASGLARTDGPIRLTGKGPLPLVDGTITFDPDPAEKVAPLSFTPRGVRKEIALLGGSVDISTDATSTVHTYTLEARDNPLTASLDGEGKLENIAGRLDLQQGSPAYARVQLDADNVPYRKPGEFDMILSARDVMLELPRGDNAAWRARGLVSIVNGAYRRNFELTDAIKPLPPKAQPVKPFWDEYPSIGNADLALTLDVRRFAVENNIAQNFELEGPRILISGSPRDPRLSGSIRVVRGEFKIPGTRAKFTRTGGSIDFAENEHAGNPKLDIVAEAPDYLDLSGQQHTITMTLSGTLEAPQWELKTNTGLNHSQTVALLTLGRTPEQLRRSLGDTSLGSDPTRIDPTTNPSTGFADQIVKDLAGDWISDLLGGNLREKVGVDVLRFELGFGSAAIHAEKKAMENIRFFGDGELTLRGRTLNIRAEVKTPWQLGRHLPWRVITNDRITVQGVYLLKDFYDPAEEDISDLQGKLVYRLFIP